MYVSGAYLFYVCCSDCVGVCGNVCCVAAGTANYVESFRTCCPTEDSMWN